MARALTLADLPLVRAPPTISAARMSEVDRAAVDELGIGVELLMENASRQAAAATRVWLGGVDGRDVVVLAGRGNNGGDALGAARHLRGWGARVTCVLAALPERLAPEVRRQHDILVRLGEACVVASLSGERLADEAAIAELLGRAAVLIDGLLGTSARGAPRGEIAALVRLANRSRVPILAVDLPSGLDPDSGIPLGVAIRASATIALGLPKPGLLEPRAAGLVGELLVADIGIPARLYERFGVDAHRLFVEGDLVRVASD